MSSQIQPGTWIRHGNSGASYVALTAAPSAATDGIPVHPLNKNLDVLFGIKHSAAGARTMTVDLYGYKPNVFAVVNGGLSEQAGTAEWAHIASFEYSSTSNDGADIHRMQGLTAFTRLYARLTASTGSPTVYLDFCFMLP